MSRIILGLIEKRKNNNNNKVLIRVMHISKFYDWFFSTFFFTLLKYTLRFRLFIADSRTTKGPCAIFKRKLALATLRVPVIFGYVRVDDHLVKLDPTWTIRTKHHQVYFKERFSYKQ